MKRVMLAGVLALMAAVTAQAATYKIDTDHSTVAFKIRHLVGRVAGRFDKFDGTFNYEAGNAKAWSATANIDPASIDTGNAKRDGHLKSPDFFDTAKYPSMKFVSTGASSVQGAKATLTGNLTMHGVTKPVTLNLELLGETKDPWGNQRASFEATGTINRKDFGIVWNKTLETGGLMVGEEVAITLDIEGVQQK